MKIDLPGLIIRPGLWDARFLAFNQADKIIVINFGYLPIKPTYYRHAQTVAFRLW